MFPRLFALAVLLGVVGCGANEGTSVLAPSGPTGLEMREAPTAPLASVAQPDELPVFDPSNFVSTVDNPYLPLPVGRVSTFEGQTEDGVETIVIEVLAEKKSILGVEATVVRDRVYLDGELVEDTFDWFAQDQQGNVWYLGEDVKNYEGGMLADTEGSWQAGVDGATAGIAMLADPEPGDAYRQELAPGVAEDMARVRRLDESVTVPYGTFSGVLQTLEWTPLSPGGREYKYYASGVGLVLETSTRGGKERVELVSLTGP
jgi:hypothetical protein